MHELGLILEVLDLATHGSQGAPVRRIVLEVGPLAAALPDALRFAFEVAREDTVAAEAELVIVQTSARAGCRACGLSLELKQAWARCSCGSGDLEWRSGDELCIRELEVA